MNINSETAHLDSSPLLPNLVSFVRDKIGLDWIIPTNPDTHNWLQWNWNFWKVCKLTPDNSLINMSWLEFANDKHRAVFFSFLEMGNKFNYSHISEATLGTLFKLSREVSEGHEVHITLNIWIGWVKSNPSVVLPSYILWWLGYLGHFYEDINTKYPNCFARLRVHLWMSEAIEFNWFPAEDTKEQSWNIISVLTNFIAAYSPNLKDMVHFDHIEITDSMRTEISEIEKKLLSSQSSDVVSLLEVFKKMWKKHGWETGSDNSLKYAISHIYGLQDVRDEESSDEYKNEYFISLWWKAERNFNHLRTLIRKTILSNKESERHVHLTSDKYLKPPYYRDEKWDVVFGESLVNNLDSLSQDRRFQLEQIIKFGCIEVSDYMAFINDQAANNPTPLTVKDSTSRNNTSHDMNNEASSDLPANIETYLSELEEAIISRRFLPHDFEEKKSTSEWQLELIWRDSVRFIWEKELLEKIKQWKKLIIKLGIDPTGDEIHIGHLIPLKKLALFQSLWYEIRFLIWTFTATIWDPDKKSTRDVLTDSQISQNIETYIQQVEKVIDLKSWTATIVYNKDWYGEWSAGDLLGLAMKWKVWQMLAKEQFKKRLEEWSSIAIWEFIYPLLQWWDSVVLKADVELGGQDQEFNLLRGRDLQAWEWQSPQAVITTPLLNGFDGQKMSKTFNNYVGIKPEENIQDKVNKDYGKMMSMTDKQMITYFHYVVSTSEKERGILDHIIQKWIINPMIIKKMLARCILRLFYSEDVTLWAEESFKQIFSKREVPDNIANVEIGFQPEWNILDLLACANALDKNLNRSEMRRRIAWWWVSVNWKKVESAFETFSPNIGDKLILKFGKGKFLKIIIK
jgi:tyrosyl-tRNA synthetase